MKVRLLQDIVIPAGTIFEKAPQKMEFGFGCVECIIELTKDCTGVVFLDACSHDAAMTQWLEIIVR